MISSKRFLGRSIILLLLGTLLCTAYGCGSRDADSSDPDPHYYKGKQFSHHKLR